MKKVLFTAVSAFIMLNAAAQTDTTSANAQESQKLTLASSNPSEYAPEHKLANIQDKVQVKYYGFVRNYLYFDTRKTLSSSGGQFCQIPMDENIDINGEDVNEVASSRLLAITTRLGLSMTGPEALGAATSAKIEADFNGYSGSTTMLRIRHAFLKLDWGKHEVLCGQTWHPMCSANLPDVLGLATGSPFQPFSRTPQISYKLKAKGFDFNLAALYQLQYTSAGPDGTSANYQTNAVLPEIFAGIDWYNKDRSWFFEVGADIQRLRPRTSTGGDTPMKVEEYVTGVSPMFYMQYKKDMFALKLKALYGQNTSHLHMMSGYGVTEVNPDGSNEYETLNNMTSWLNLSYGKKHKVNVFFGYSKNLGATEDLLTTYVRGYRNIDQMFRIAPSYCYNLKHFNLGLEYEMTSVAYGETMSDGTVENTHNVANHRLCALIKYNF
ncbi:MAG: hypothetical protein J6R41_05680 [Paludibacteraceae bacterium]|nr:hypothetical protein [Paludibacteraceae bacterium]